MSVSVVVPYHSNRKLLDLCLSTLLRTVPDTTEVVLVLNNADEREIDLTWPDRRVRHLRFPQNLGYSRAINAGVAEARGETLVLCDADSFFPYPWYEQLLSFHRAQNPKGLSSVKLLNPISGRVIDFGMGLTQYNNAHPFKDRRPNHPLVARSRRAQMACSACMMIDKRIFVDAGGMDEDLHNFYQDTDLCLRLKELGHETWVTAEAVAFHQGDSARSARAPYRADVKGIYYAKNAHRMDVDMQDYFLESARHSLKGDQGAGKYNLIDLSTVADHLWHRDIIRDLFDIDGVFEAFSGQRDEADLDFINMIPQSFLNARQPNLYFVDRFVCSIRNHLWRHLRRGRGDMVIDRNANIEPLEAVDDF